MAEENDPDAGREDATGAGESLSAPGVEDPRSAIVAELDATKAQLVEMRARRAQLDREIAAALDREAALDAKLNSPDSTPGHIRDTMARMDYIRAQDAARRERAVRRVTALDRLGGSTEDLKGQSALDAAHARRTARGARRPNFEPKV